MELRLFSDRSIWTMLHGIVLGGGALITLFAALFYLWAARPVAASRVAESDPTGVAASSQARYFAVLAVATAVVLWLAVIIGTYVNFPPYRATPPEGASDLSRYPRALLMSSPGTTWLHRLAMETKEHVPWIAAMMATPVAFVAVRYRSRLLTEAPLRRTALTALAICFVLVAIAALLGTFVNKVAPLD